MRLRDILVIFYFRLREADNVSLYLMLFTSTCFFVVFQFGSAQLIHEVLFGRYDLPELVLYRYYFFMLAVICCLIEILSAFVMCICIQELWKRQLKKKGRIDYGCFSVESR